MFKIFGNSKFRCTLLTVLVLALVTFVIGTPRVNSHRFIRPADSWYIVSLDLETLSNNIGAERSQYVVVSLKGALKRRVGCNNVRIFRALNQVALSCKKFNPKSLSREFQTRYFIGSIEKVSANPEITIGSKCKKARNNFCSDLQVLSYINNKLIKPTQKFGSESSATDIIVNRPSFFSCAKYSANAIATAESRGYRIVQNGDEGQEESTPPATCPTKVSNQLDDMSPQPPVPASQKMTAIGSTQVTLQSSSVTGPVDSTSPLIICDGPGCGDGGGDFHPGGGYRKCTPETAELQGCTPNGGSSGGSDSGGYGTPYRPSGGARLYDDATPLTVPLHGIPILWGYGGNAPSGVDLSTGAHGQQINIEVPPFHGLEPTISVNYNSSSGNKFAGVGWDISGFSAIVGVSRSGGNLLFDGSDRFFVDGAEVLRCDSLPSAQRPVDCLGGNPSLVQYFTKSESFSRIELYYHAYHSPLGQTFYGDEPYWIITHRNGTQVTYKALIPPGITWSEHPELLRHWGVAKVEDLHGNAVEYRWALDSGEFYPDRVLYNGNEIRIYRASRPDSIERATCGDSLAQMTRRLSSIAVYVPGHIRSLYRFSYRVSATNRSLLTKMELFGDNVTVNEAGEVTNSGSAQPLPATNYEYIDSNFNFPGTSSIATSVYGKFCSAPPSSAVSQINNEWDDINKVLYSSQDEQVSFEKHLMPVDINHDNCTDLLASDVLEVKTWISKCDGTFNAPTVTVLDSPGEPLFGDFNGDGNIDFFYVPGSPPGPVQIRVYLGNTNGSFSKQTNYQNSPRLPWRTAPPTDFLGVMGETFWDAKTWQWLPVLDAVHTLSYRTARAAKLRVVDLNGDKCDDIVALNGCDLHGGSDCQQKAITVYFSKCGSPDQPFQGFDFSGNFSDRDSQGDTPGVPTNIYTYIHGASAPYAGNAISTWIGHVGYQFADLARCLFADFDANGRPDLLCLSPGNQYGYLTGSTNLYLSEGNGTQFSRHENVGPVVPTNDFYGYYASRDAGKYPVDQLMRPLDYNGDGLLDIAIFPQPETIGYIQIYKNLGNARFSGPTNGPLIDFRDWKVGYDRALPQYSAISTGDLDGDGKADIGHFDPNSKTISFELATGRMVAGPSVKQPGCLFEGDFNGDGVTDFAVAKDSGDFTGPLTIYSLSGTNTELADLMKSVSNGIGGRIEFEYDIRRDLIDGESVPFKVVSHIRNITADQTIDTEYRYGGGKTDRSSVDGPKFLGFRWAASIVPPANGLSQRIITTHYYAQDQRAPREEKVDVALEIPAEEGAGPGTVESQIEAMNAGVPFSNVLLSRLSYEYTLVSELPYRVSLMHTESEVYDPICHEIPGQPRVCSTSSLGSKARTNFTYDDYGNTIKTINQGDLAVSGDELITEATFVSNLEKFILGVPAHEKVYAGSIEADSALLSETAYYFDGQDNPEAAPEYGLLTRIDRRKCINCSPAGGGGGSPNGNSEYVTERMGYDPHGNLNWTEDPLHNRTTIIYDPVSQIYPISVTNALSQTATSEWDPWCGVPYRITDLNQQTTTTTLDEYCRPLTTTGPTGSYLTSEYCDHNADGCGTPGMQHSTVYTRSPIGGQIYFKSYFDGLGRVFKSESPSGSSLPSVFSEAAFDSQGNRYRTSYPYPAGIQSSLKKWVNSEYDPSGRPIAITRPDNSRINAGYLSYQTTTTNEIGQLRRDTVDSRGRLIRIEHAAGVGQPFKTTQTFEYDLTGRAQRITDGSGVSELYNYDLLGRLESVVSPQISGTSYYTYDDAGHLLSEKDAKGQITSYEYDALGRMTKKTIHDENNNPQVFNYTYDEARPGFFNIGKLTSSYGPAEENHYNYDKVGHLLNLSRIIDNINYKFEWGYDPDGRLLWQKYPDNDYVGSPTTPLKYDSLGRLKAIPGYVSDASYDPVDGTLTQLTYANGEVVKYAYDPIRKWPTQIETSLQGTVSERLSYQDIDQIGKIKKLAFLNGSSWDYKYNSFNELTFASYFDAVKSSRSVQRTFSYDGTGSGNMLCNSKFGGTCADASGNPTSYQNYIYDYIKPHELKKINSLAGGAAGQRFQYDENGNMTLRENGSPSALLWNSEHRPVQVGNTRLVYDASNARLKKISDNNTTLYLGNGVEVEDEVLNKYVNFAGLPVAQKKGGVVQWLNSDRTGSIYRITNAKGQELWKRTYLPYGEELALTSPDKARSTFGFAGTHNDSDTGLQYMNARYYDPAIAKFISPDPLVTSTFPQGTNAYGYAANDPVNKSDPTGMYTWVDYQHDQPLNTNLVFPHVFGRITGRYCSTCGSFSIAVVASGYTPPSSSGSASEIRPRINTGETLQPSGMVAVPPLRSGVVASNKDAADKSSRHMAALMDHPVRGPGSPNGMDASEAYSMMMAKKQLRGAIHNEGEIRRVTEHEKALNAVKGIFWHANELVRGREGVGDYLAASANLGNQLGAVLDRTFGGGYGLLGGVLHIPESGDDMVVALANVALAGAGKVAAAATVAVEEGAARGATTVYRVMSELEHQLMVESGEVQLSNSGLTHASLKPGTYTVRPGLLVKFDVPTENVVPSSGNGWVQIRHPMDNISRLMSRLGRAPPKTPTATNIEVIGKVGK